MHYGYTLEQPRQGDSNEYPQSEIKMYCNTIDKNISFSLIKFIGEYTCTRLLVSARVLGREYVRSNE